MTTRLNRRQLLAAAWGTALWGPTSAQAASDQAHSARLDRFETSRHVVKVRGLDPAHDGLLVAQLSDIHVGRDTPYSRVLGAVRAINAARPEVVFLTGDYVTFQGDPFEDVPRLLAGITAPTFAVLGNHDIWTKPDRLRRGLSSIGFEVLRNQHTVTRVRGAPLTVLGVDDGFTRHDDVAKTFAGAPKGGTRVVLTHNPPTADRLPKGANVLCLAGHTHGGQVSIPGVTDLLFRSMGQRYLRGLYPVGGNQLYVNRGLGFGRGGPRVRVRSEPELTLLELRAA